MARMLWLWTLLCLVGCVASKDISKDEKQIAARSRTSLGLAYLEQKQWQRARENLIAAVAIAPNNKQALMGLAYYLQQVDEDEQAKLLYKTALRLTPDDPDLLNNYGTFLCHIGQYEKAEKAFLNAIAQQGYYMLAASYENAGLCALKFNQTNKAKKWFKKAVAHEPNRYISTLYLVKMELGEKAYDQVNNRLVLFHHQYGYRAATLLAMVKLMQAQNTQFDKYARLLAEQFPQSQEYRQYLANEY